MARKARSNCWYASPGPAKVASAPLGVAPEPTLALLLHPKAQKATTSARFEILRTAEARTAFFSVPSPFLRILPFACTPQAGCVPTMWGTDFFRQRVWPYCRQRRAGRGQFFQLHHPPCAISRVAIAHRDRIRRIPYRTES